MIFLTALMCALLGYQVTMPSVDNAKYTFTSHNNQIIRMNTQTGEMTLCDNLTCEKSNENTK
jgi:hypothetical protein